MSEAVLPEDGRAAGAARRLVRDEVRSLGLDELEEEAVLLTSELVTNVVVHVGSSPRLAVHKVSNGLRVEVSDDSSVTPALRHSSGLASTGRGMRLVEMLADDWGWVPVEGGKTVWFELHLPRTASREWRGSTP